MATADKAFDPFFEGDERQPGFDSVEADMLRAIIGFAQTQPENLTLVKADWDDLEVTAIVAIENEDVNDFGVSTIPVAVLITEDVFRKLSPRGEVRIEG